MTAELAFPATAASRGKTMRITTIEDLHCNAGWRDFSFLKIGTDDRAGRLVGIHGSRTARRDFPR